MSKWPEVALGDIFDIARGGSPRPIDDYITDADDGVNWISISDASDSEKFITKTKKKIIKEGVTRSRLVKPGDFLLTNSMSFGRPYIMATDGCIHDGWLVLSKKIDNVDQDYFFHLLGSESTYRKFKSLAAGAVVKNLNIDLVKSVIVPLPPLEEQKRIAAILDKVDSLRRKRAQAIALADDFLRATFLDIFGDPASNPNGWPVYKLRDLVEVGDKINYGIVQPGEDVFDGGVPLVRSGDLRDVTPDVTKLRYVSHATDQKHRKSKLKGNEVLIACVGTIGKVGFVTEEMIGWNIARAVARIPIKSEVNREYVYRYLQSAIVQGFFQKETRTVAQPTLNVGLIEATPIALPPEYLQLEYLARHTKTQRFIVVLNEQIKELERLASSLSISMMAG